MKTTKYIMCRALLIMVIMCLMMPLKLSASQITDRAAKAYNQELYTEALKLYQEAEKTEGTSASLCCNIGDTYYRLKDNAHAIVYYERALLLDPSHSDARFNLEFVRQKAGKINPPYYLTGEILKSSYFKL